MVALLLGEKSEIRSGGGRSELAMDDGIKQELRTLRTLYVYIYILICPAGWQMSNRICKTKFFLSRKQRFASS